MQIPVPMVEPRHTGECRLRALGWRPIRPWAGPRGAGVPAEQRLGLRRARAYCQATDGSGHRVRAWATARNT